MGRTFFGLTQNNKDIFLEQIFILMYYMGFTWVEAYNIPVWQRRWFIERIQTEIKQSQEQTGQATPTHAYHQNTPDARAMMGRYRSHVPANLRRYT